MLVFSISIAAISLVTYAASSLIKSIRSYQSCQQEYASYRLYDKNAELAQAQLESQYTFEENQPKQPAETKPPVIWTPAPVTTAFLDYNYKLIRLRDKNKDLIGWINIPGTVVDYPIVQTINNSYYMDHTFAKRKNAGGAIFMDYRGNNAFQDDISLVYGHHMKDGSMFSSLRQYKSVQFLLSHQRIQIETYTDTYQYQVFAAFHSNKNDDFLYYNQSKDNIRQELLSFLIRKNGHIIGQVNWPKDQPILFLTTCDYGNPQGDFWTVAAFKTN